MHPFFFFYTLLYESLPLYHLAPNAFDLHPLLETLGVRYLYKGHQKSVHSYVIPTKILQLNEHPVFDFSITMETRFLIFFLLAE